MNYDPIHDTYTDSALGEDANTTDSFDGGINTSANEASPPRKALSISSLVSPANHISNLMNANEVDNETEGENDIDDDNDNEEEYEQEHELEGEVDDGEHNGKGQKKKAAGKAKKSSSSSLPKGVRHLKKSDGEPFWRRDIQHDFLQELFDDETSVFTNYFPYCEIPACNNDPKLTFSELYIRTLAESGKCSKILKERLLKDNEMGKSVGKVCLLVNAGRMNTTVNFVPEMRSSLRTYHSIPSLQADPVYGGSKPLQDTPRLKSILKAVCDGQEHLKSLDDILNNPSPEKPNTNVIQLIFLLSSNVKGIKYHHDHSISYNNNNNSFMEFFLNARIHPKNRAKRFLWLIYTYLETSFTEEELANNPFNSHVIPPIEYIPEDQLDNFDRDTDFEIEYSEKMYRTRLRYLADEEHNSNPKRGNKSKKGKENSEVDDNSFVDDTIDTTIDHQLQEQQISESGESKKRPASIEDSKSRKRKGKRNPTMHHTVISSPLTKSVITFSLENSRKKLHEPISSTDGEAKEISNENGNETKEKTSDTSEDLPTTNLDHISFPIEGIDKLVKLYCPGTSIPLVPNDSVSMSTRHNIINKSRQIIRQIRNSSKSNGVEFARKTEILMDWLYRFFQYKKSTANGLLGMEWEDLRYDIINGIESYLYQQLGKSISLDRSQPQTTKKNEANLNNLGGQIDLANIEEVGFGYVPIHDFNRANERNLFMLELISYCNEWHSENYQDEKDQEIKFDLANEEVMFS